MQELLELINVSIEDPRGQEVVRKWKLVESEEPDFEEPDLQGEDAEEEEFFLENREAGIEIHLNGEKIVQVILLYAEGYEESRQYPGPLLHGLTFASGREEVLKRLGKPVKTIDGASLAFLGKMGMIDSFVVDGRGVLFQFKVGNGGIDVITVTASAAV